ncbi:MAG: TSUP family transporter [Dehalococcoidia bacterium]
MPVWVVALATVFVGGACQGLTGFGFALIVVPLLSIAWDVKATVAAAALLGLASIIPLLVQVRAQVQLKLVLTLLVGTVVGTPAGLAMLVVLNADALKIWVAFVVISLSVLFALSPRLRPKGESTGASVAVGTVAGLLRGSTGMGGAPIAFYLLGHQRGLEGFRSTFIAFQLPAILMVVVGFVVAGQVTPDVLAVAGVSLPALLLGLWLGATLRYRVRPSMFQAIVLAVLVITSAAAIASVVVG